MALVLLGSRKGGIRLEAPAQLRGRARRFRHSGAHIRDQIRLGRNRSVCCVEMHKEQTDRQTFFFIYICRIEVITSSILSVEVVTSSTGVTLIRHIYYKLLY